MRLKNRMQADPIPVVRQLREVRLRSVTTMPPGKMAPIAAFNLLRMDGCTGRVNVAVEMAETYEVLMNRTFMRISAWFVPHVALDRFQASTAIFERSYNGEPMTKEDGAEVVPYIETKAYPETAGSHEVYKVLGVTAKASTMVNTSYEESYNQIVNYVRRNRSKSLDERDLDDSTLAAALWGDSAFSEVVPDFDDGMIAGELPLSVVAGRMPVTTEQAANGKVSVREAGAADNRFLREDGGNILVGVSTPRVELEELYADLSTDGISVSLANIDQARKLVDWAKLRERYEGHKDAYIIDTLMAGIAVEDQHWFHPMLLDQQMVEIKQVKRMATDGANLEEGVANGVGSGSLGINVPANTYGGVVMILAEAFPEQLYERQADPWFTATAVDDLPNYRNDVLNPMPVVEVKNGQVDVDHDVPDGLFGWARRNWQWARWPSRVGGDLYAPDADAATAVARRSIWATDVENPTLSEEFYLATTLGREVFVDQTADPLKVGIGGSVSISGLTVIGEVHESEANYSEMRQAVPPLQLPDKS